MIINQTDITDGTVWTIMGYTTETDSTLLSSHFLSILRKAKLSVLGESEYNFTPQGFTKVFLLGESHFALHTWPERHISWFELASCSEGKYSSFLIELKKLELPGLRIENEIVCRP